MKLSEFGKKTHHRAKWIGGATAVLGLLGVSGASAFPIDAGNDDLVINWDQSVRYNYGQRIQSIDQRGPASTAVRDESEYAFRKGNTVLNRVDLFSEFDVSYRRSLGFRITGSAWYDDAYGSKGASNPALAGQESYPGNVYSPYVRRYYHGPSGEFNDAFAWANVAVPAGTANFKIGRFSQLWGEAVFGTASANSVAASMSPSDGQKSALSPGATAKETLLPIGQIAANIPLSESLSLAAQYTLEYRASRSPEGGTFLGLNDITLNGPVRTFAGSTALDRIDPIEGKKGDIGLMLKYSPQWLNGDTVGLVLRKFDDKSLGYANTSVPGRFYRFVANRDVKLIGLTYATTVLGASVGAELNYREGQGLAGSLNTATLTPARGDTIHGLVNATKTFGQTPLWSTAALVGEVSWMQLRKVTDNPTSYAGNTAACATQDVVAGCPTKNAYHLAVSFTPTWLQVAPSVDLSMPITYMRGLKGNGAAIASGINEGAGVLSLGLSANFYNKYTVAITYNNYFNQHRGTGATYVNNGASANYDKDWVGISFQTNF